MTNSKNTKRALLSSVLAMLLCVVMLIGTTFAWFTDSVTTGKNKIVAGNLDVELYTKNAAGEYVAVDENTTLFDEKALWEPGYTQVVYLKVKNEGTLALKYQFAVNVISEVPGENADGDAIKLSDYLVFGQAVNESEVTYAPREAAWAAAGSTLGLNNYTKTNEQMLPGAEEYVALVVYMPTTVGNEANYRGDTAPSIELGVTLFASQTPYEKDSFDDQYDKGAKYDLPPETFDVSTASDITAALESESPVILNVTTDITNVDNVNITGDVTIDLTQMTQNGQGIHGNTMTVENGGNLTVNGAWVTGGQTSQFGIKKLVASGAGSTVTMSDVHFGASSSAGATAITAADSAKITITGGYYTTSGNSSTIVCADGGTVEITGGYFRGTGKQGPVFNVLNGGKIVIAKDVYENNVRQTSGQNIPATCQAVLDGDNYIITEK